MRLKQALGLTTLRGVLRFYTILLVALPIALAGGFFSIFQRGEVLGSETAQLALSLHQEGNVVNFWLRERFDDMDFLARLEPVVRGDTAGILEAFKAYLATHNFISAAVYVSPDGHTLVDSAGSPSVYVGDRAYFKEARAGRQALVSGIIGRTSGKPICLFAVPVPLPEGRFGGVIFMSMELDILDKWLREGSGKTVAGDILCDGEGRILAPAAAHEAFGGDGQARLPQQLLNAGPKGRLYSDARGREMIGVAVPLGAGGWRLVREVPVDDVLAGYRGQSVVILVGALATMILVIPLAFWLCRSLERPLELLAHYARELRQKKYDETCSLLAPGAMPDELNGLFEAFADMACQVRAHIDETERLSVLDALTDLYNRRFLFSGGLKLVMAALRAGQHCTCLMLDVDHFKRVNDTFGHQAGDQVLAHVGHLLVAAVRKSDLVARYGGEEFVVLLIGAGLAEGLELAERIRRGMAEQPCPAAGRTLAVTVSVGVAEVRSQMDFDEAALDDLLARADAAMYAAKAAGRNRVVADQPDTRMA